jgi:IS30 family transposase
MRVSAETIYQSLYVQSRGALRRDLTRCLRTGRALRRPGRQANKRRNQIPDMINITERPAEADDRAVPGHWEGDLILGKNNLSAIGTLVERATGYTMLVHLPDGYKTEQVRDALTQKIKTIPDILRASLTWDQGAEMGAWKQVSVAADIDIYSAIHTHLGNAAPVRTPTGCCASTSRRAPTCRFTAPWTSSGSRPSSTTDRANA